MQNEGGKTQEGTQTEKNERSEGRLALFPGFFFFIGFKNGLILKRFFFDLCIGNAFGLLLFFHEFPVEQNANKADVKLANFTCPARTLPVVLCGGRCVFLCNPAGFRWKHV